MTAITSFKNRPYVRSFVSCFSPNRIFLSAGIMGALSAAVYNLIPEGDIQTAFTTELNIGASIFLILMYIGADLIGKGRRPKTKRLPVFKTLYYSTKTRREIKVTLEMVRDCLLEDKPLLGGSPDIFRAAVLLKNIMCVRTWDIPMRWAKIFLAMGSEEEITKRVEQFGQLHGLFAESDLLIVAWLKSLAREGSIAEISDPEILAKLEKLYPKALWMEFYELLVVIAKMPNREDRREAIIFNVDEDFLLSGRFGLTKEDLYYAEILHIVNTTKKYFDAVHFLDLLFITKTPRGKELYRNSIDMLKKVGNLGFDLDREVESIGGSWGHYSDHAQEIRHLPLPMLLRARFQN